MKTKHPFFASCKDVWILYYKEKKGEDYYWTAKDSVHLHQLMKKIESKLVGRSMEVTLDNMVNSTKAFFLSVTDKWLLENLELCKVNSNFNSLYVNAVKQSPLNSSNGVRDSVEDYLRRKNSQRTVG